MSHLDPLLAKKTVNALQRSSLFAFTWKVFETLHMGENDAFVPNWHVQAMCHALEEVESGNNRRLVITVPPRHLKSITTAVALPAYLLGQDPSTKILVASYGLDLAKKHSEDFRRILESQWYINLFPATRIAVRGARQDEIQTTAGGGRKAVSIGGAVTGFGADYIIVDDLLKAADANSETEIERAKDFLEGTLISRFNNPKKGRVIVIQQRLHEDDPAGYLLAKGIYKHLNLPAIAEEDEDIQIRIGSVHQRKKGTALFPQVLDLDDLEFKRKEMGTANFNMQYQQNPLAFDGSVLRWEWFGTYEKRPDRSWFQYVVQSWDTAMSADPKSDYSVCITCGFRENKWYLLDVYRERLDYPQLKKEVLGLKERWNPERVLIEKAATGIPLLQDCRSMDRACFNAVQPVQSKDVRFNAACAPVEAGRLVLPREAIWLQDFKHELMGFPRAKFDDQVDSFSQFVNWASGKGFRRLSGAGRRRRDMRRR